MKDIRVEKIEAILNETETPFVEVVINSMDVVTITFGSSLWCEVKTLESWLKYELKQLVSGYAGYINYGGGGHKYSFFLK